MISGDLTKLIKSHCSFVTERSNMEGITCNSWGYNLIEKDTQTHLYSINPCHKNWFILWPKLQFLYAKDNNLQLVVSGRWPYGFSLLPSCYNETNNMWGKKFLSLVILVFFLTYDMLEPLPLHASKVCRQKKPVCLGAFCLIFLMCLYSTSH